MAQDKSRFHSLPLEVREMIYAHAVVSASPLPTRMLLRDVEKPEASSSDGTTFATELKLTPGQPALSRVDRRTRAEALKAFYTQNTFLFRATWCDRRPVDTWGTAAQHFYSEATLALVRQTRHIALEWRIEKNCLPIQLLPRPPQTHLYRINIEAPPKQMLRVRYAEDLERICSCTLQAAAAAKTQLGGCVMDALPESHAFGFADDVESEARWHLGHHAGGCQRVLCHKSNLSRCKECGKEVFSDSYFSSDFADLLERYEDRLKEERKSREREARLEERLRGARVEHPFSDWESDWLFGSEKDDDDDDDEDEDEDESESEQEESSGEKEVEQSEGDDWETSGDDDDDDDDED